MWYRTLWQQIRFLFLAESLSYSHYQSQSKFFVTCTRTKLAKDVFRVESRTDIVVVTCAKIQVNSNSKIQVTLTLLKSNFIQILSSSCWLGRFGICVLLSVFWYLKHCFWVALVRAMISQTPQWRSCYQCFQSNPQHLNDISLIRCNFVNIEWSICVFNPQTWHQPNHPDPPGFFVSNKYFIRAQLYDPNPSVFKITFYFYPDSV